MCYGISSGEAFDAEGNVSKQLDVVIYDRIFSYLIPYSDNFIQFPCESIYGIIEIKSYLNTQELETAIQNIKSLKVLKREGTHDWVITPLTEIHINGKPDNTNRNPYFGIVFAYDSVEWNTVFDCLRNSHELPCHLPNAIILLKKQIIILPYNSKTNMIVLNTKESFDYFITIHTTTHTLSLFIGLLIEYTRYTLLKVPNMRAIIKHEFEQIINQQWEQGNRGRMCPIQKNK